MTDSTDVEVRLRQTYRAITDAVPAPPVDPPWTDGAPLDLEGHIPGDGGRRLLWTAAAAGILVIAGVTAVIGGPDSPPLEMFPTATEPSEPTTTAAPEPTTVGEVDDDMVTITLVLPHAGALDTGSIDLWVWHAEGGGCITLNDGVRACWPDSPGSPGWRPLYMHLTPAGTGESRTDGDELTWTSLTFRVPPPAANTLADHQLRLAVTASPGMPSCLPSSPDCAEVRIPPPFSLPTPPVDVPTTPTSIEASPTPTPIVVHRQYPDDALGGEALTPGVLDMNASGCVTLNGNLVVWPVGTRAAQTDSGWQILLPSGEGAPFGSLVSIGGASISLDFARQIVTAPIPEPCATEAVVDAWSLEEGVTTPDEIVR